MKLPIKHKYFMMIKHGKKDVEHRDAHITFIDEETGETLRKDVIDVAIAQTKYLPDDIKELFEDETVIAFRLRK